MVALMLHGMAALIMLVSMPVSTASFEWVLLIESTEMWRLFSTYMIGDNRPFYSCVPSDLAFEWKRGWR